MAFKKEAKKTPAKKAAPAAAPTPAQIARRAPAVEEDIHAIYTLLAKLEAKVDELTDRCNAAVQALASEPAKAVQEEEMEEKPSRGTCHACAAELDEENSSVTPTGKIVHTSCKVKPLGSPAPSTPKSKVTAPTLEALRVAVQGYVERHGREAAETLLNEAGYSKVSEVPEAERADAIEAFSG